MDARIGLARELHCEQAGMLARRPPLLLNLSHAESATGLKALTSARSTLPPMSPNTS